MAELPPDTPPEASEADQRKNLRAPLLALKVHAGDGQKFFYGYTKNISRSGMFVSTLKLHEPGTRLLLEVTLPSPVSRRIQFQCEVVWIRSVQKNSPLDPGVGLKFLDLPEETSDILDTWVKENS
jgi:uncharacterized protein (TIGR02266 family)